jgi:hypothetical protein
METSTHTSTSESIKTRPRTKPGAKGKGGAKRIAESNSSDAVSAVENSRKQFKPESQPKLNFQPMTPVHYDELSGIWPADRRIPSAKSRRAWAHARNLRPDVVNRWWYRRKLVAKKAHIIIPKDTYDLAVGMPPTLCAVVKHEGEDAEDVEEWQAKKLSELTMGGNSADNFPLERSSSPCSDATTTTVFDSMSSSSDSTSITVSSLISDFGYTVPHGKLAYTQSSSSLSRCSSPLSDTTSLLPTATLYYTSLSLPPSLLSSTSTPCLEPEDALLAGLGWETLSCGLNFDYLLGPQPDELIAQVQCNQGLSDISDFTCLLCRAHISPGVHLFSTVVTSFKISFVPYLVSIFHASNYYAHTQALLDDPPNDALLPSPDDRSVPQTPGALGLMGELSAIPRLWSVPSQDQDQQSPQEDILYPFSLSGVPAHHYLDYNDPRSGLGLRLGDRSRSCLEQVYRHGRGSWCIGGNNYSYDGFFVGRCQDGCVDFVTGDESGPELWNFGFPPPNLDELDTGI